MTYKRNCLWLAGTAFLLCIFALSFMGCGTTGCPRPESLTGKVRPLRTVLVVDRLTDYGGSMEIDENAQTYTRDETTGHGNRFIMDCGQLWFEQTGIKIEIVETIVIPRWMESGYNDAVLELREIISHIDPNDYDMAIGIGMSIGSTLGAAAAMLIPHPIWAGVIEDKYRRYMRLKVTDCWIFLHELAHAFIFETLHSGGLLSSFTIFSTGSICLLEDDFNELLENKFRDFNELVRY